MQALKCLAGGQGIPMGDFSQHVLPLLLVLAEERHGECTLALLGANGEDVRFIVSSVFDEMRE